MTDKIYLTDAYVKEFNATITGISDGITLDKTAFYPTGGGQPCDTGVIKLQNGAAYKVVEVRKSMEEVVHILENYNGLNVGEPVSCSLDWEKRYMHMRLHTMLHIIDGIVYKKYKGAITGGQIYDTKARMDFDVPNLDKNMVAQIVAEAQQIVGESHAVLPKILTKEEAKSIEGLARTAPGEKLMDKLEEVRVIDIEGFDFQLDGGTHVSNTKEVGIIKLLKYENKGSHNKRVELGLE